MKAIDPHKYGSRTFIYTDESVNPPVGKLAREAHIHDSGPDDISIQEFLVPFIFITDVPLCFAQIYMYLCGSTNYKPLLAALVITAGPPMCAIILAKSLSVLRPFIEQSKSTLREVVNSENVSAGKS